MDIVVGVEVLVHVVVEELDVAVEESVESATLLCGKQVDGEPADRGAGCSRMGGEVDQRVSGRFTCVGMCTVSAEQVEGDGSALVPLSADLAVMFEVGVDGGAEGGDGPDSVCVAECVGGQVVPGEDPRVFAQSGSADLDEVRLGAGEIDFSVLADGSEKVVEVQAGAGQARVRADDPIEGFVGASVAAHTVVDEGFDGEAGVGDEQVKVVSRVVVAQVLLDGAADCIRVLAAVDGVGVEEVGRPVDGDRALLVSVTGGDLDPGVRWFGHWSARFTNRHHEVAGRVLLVARAVLRFGVVEVAVASVLRCVGAGLHDGVSSRACLIDVPEIARCGDT
jgi:hypothetical protein